MDPSCRLWSQKSTLTPCAPFPRDRRESELHDDGRDAGAEAVARRGGLRSIAVATYQAVSGAGREGVDELSNQLEKSTATTCAPSPSTVRVSAGLRRQVPPHCAQRDPDAGRFLTTAHSRPREKKLATKVERSSRFPVCSLTRRVCASRSSRVTRSHHREFRAPTLA